MFYALNWFVVVGLFMLWSLAAWAFHSLAVWTVANAGVLSGGAGALGALQVPGWLAVWIPAEYASSLNAIAAYLAPVVQAVVDWAPAMAGGVSMAVWTVWAIGAVLLILLGFLISGLIAVLRGRVFANASASSNLATAR